MDENLVLISKLIVAMGGIISAIMVFFDASKKKSTLREEYKFAREFLDDTSKEKLHPYTLGKGYQAIAGTTAVKALEIEYILALENPIQCLNDFVLSKQLFERLDTDGDFKLIFKDKYKSDFSRRWRKIMYLSLYFILALAALSPWILSSVFKLEILKFLALLVFTVPVLGFYAWMSLQAYSKLIRSEHIFNNQRQHTPRVVIGEAKTKSARRLG